MRENRLAGRVLFHDAFDEAGPPLADHWSATAPGDDAPGGSPAVQLDTTEAPAAAKQQGGLAILESGTPGERWLSTRQAFDWTPDKPGQWIQVTFDLLANKAGSASTPAERIPYFVAAHDFDDNSTQAGGNVLVDGHPDGGAVVYLDYPGSDSKIVGNLGTSRYEPGHNYGVRVTHVEADKFLVEQLYDSVPEEKTVTLSAADLPDGGFAFEYSLGRCFIVDNVAVEASDPSTAADEAAKAAERFAARRKELEAAIKDREHARGDKPGKLAWVTDRSATPPEVHLLQRGNYATPGEKVEPAPLSALAEPEVPLDVAAAAANLPDEHKTTGRRLAWARWLTRPGSRPAALMARVQVNRLWQHHFGTGIVATTENLGASGAPPAIPS